MQGKSNVYLTIFRSQCVYIVCTNRKKQKKKNNTGKFKKKKELSINRLNTIIMIIMTRYR